MQYTSDFFPGGPAFIFLDGRIHTLKVNSVEFVDPSLCGGGDPYGVAVHVTMPDNSQKCLLDGQGVFPSVERALESVLPEGFAGRKVSLSGDPALQGAAPAPAKPTPAPAPAKPTAAQQQAKPAAPPAQAPVKPAPRNAAAPPAPVQGAPARGSAKSGGFAPDEPYQGPGAMRDPGAPVDAGARNLF